jgi:hypothetical protein
VRKSSRRFLIDSRQCCSKGAEVGIGVAFAEPRLIFVEGDVQLPMQIVLDAPVTPHGIGETTTGLREPISFGS